MEFCTPPLQEFQLLSQDSAAIHHQGNVKESLGGQSKKQHQHSGGDHVMLEPTAHPRKYKKYMWFNYCLSLDGKIKLYKYNKCTLFALNLSFQLCQQPHRNTKVWLGNLNLHSLGGRTAFSSISFFPSKEKLF